jgi:beta-lactamase superfamily II metal-dependent hydrolase
MKKLLGFYLFIIISFFAFRYPLYLNSDKFTLTFLDIGQGDSVLIRTPSNCLMLVDAGNLNKLTDKLINPLHFNQKTIDLAIVTHPDLDHYGGFLKLQQSFQIKHAFLSNSLKTNQYYQKLLQNFQNQSTQIHKHSFDQSYLFCGIRVDVLTINSDTSNGSSVITLLTFPDQTKVLLAGDIEKNEEASLIQKYPNLHADILKANHHGSKTSNTADFLQKVNPRYFIIQSGEDNNFGHPHPQTLQNIYKSNSIILRNDLQGDISFFFESSKKRPQTELKYQTQY